MHDRSPEVKLRFYATLRAKAGCEEVTCHASKLKDELAFLRNRFGGDFNKHLNYCHIFVNQDNVAFLNGPNTRLHEGDVLHMMPPTGGG